MKNLDQKFEPELNALKLIKLFKKAYRILLLTGFILLTYSLTGQNIGISETGLIPHESAALDIEFTNRGLLIPRVSLQSNTDILTIVSPATSLLVYNTNVAPNVTPGYYYWNGSKWLRFETTESSISPYWSTTGNAGTSASTHFIGTTDSVAFLAKVNNRRSAIIDPIGLTVFGYQAALNTNAYSNTALGFKAMRSNSTGNYNTAVGVNSLYSNLSGSSNIAIGYNASFSNTFGTNNCAIGNNALFANVSGGSNIVIGDNALRSGQSASYNVAIGESSLYTNSSGFNNCAIGYHAMYDNINGPSNIAIGYESFSSNTDGGNNIVIGTNAMLNSTTGSFNIVLGSTALQTITNTSGNVSIGQASLSVLSAGNYNTSIGNLSNYATTNLSNSIAIGNQCFNTADNQARIGNAVITSIGGQVSWTTLSDGRFKTDIQENVPGLAFIMKLRPVTYHHNMEAFAAFLKTPDSLRMYNDESKAADVLRTGLIAQEVEAAAAEIGFDFHGVDKPLNKESFYGLRYAEFTLPLIKALQEQQITIEQLQTTLAVQQKLNDELLNQLSKMQQQIQLLLTR